MKDESMERNKSPKGGKDFGRCIAETETTNDKRALKLISIQTAVSIVSKTKVNRTFSLYFLFVQRLELSFKFQNFQEIKFKMKFTSAVLFLQLRCWLKNNLFVNSTDLERWLWLVVIHFDPLHFHFRWSFMALLIIYFILFEAGSLRTESWVQRILFMVHDKCMAWYENYISCIEAHIHMQNE